MSKIFTLLLMVCVFIGCNSHKNEDSIVFISLHSGVLYDTIDKPYLHIKQYAEYKFSNKDSLSFGIQGNYNYYDDNYRIDNEKPFYFGLEKFYTNKIDKSFSELMTKILNGEYKESYVLNLKGKQKVVFYFDEYRLPEELRKADSLIRNQINLSSQMSDKPNFSLQTILNLQDSLFRRLPPPPPPLKLFKFTPPIINGHKNKK